MDSSNKSSLPKSPNAKQEEDSTKYQITGDQNIVEGGENIVFQGGQIQKVEITQNQYFGSQPPVKDLKSPDAQEIITRQYFEPETILIPEGLFWMGSEAGPGIPVYETPRHEVELPAYRIGICPVTNLQYQEFIIKTNKKHISPAMLWDGLRVRDGEESLPVIGITWYEALEYCEWLGTATNRKYSLPTEAQWEKACRAGGATAYPWGDAFDPTRCNHGQTSLASVQKYIAQNTLGCFDLVGNVRQWTATLWGEKRSTPDPRYAYPWKADRRNDLDANDQIWRVVRGGSYLDDISQLRCSARDRQLPNERGFTGKRYGFRVVLNIE